MGRRCTCARLLAAVEADPRLRTLPLAVRMLFLLVAEAAARSPVPGLLPFAETRRVSLLVSAPETDVETGVETLLAEGLLRRDGPGLAVPLLLDAPARAEVARRNGAAGGRPRKGESREAYRERRQQELLLPVSGGGAAGAAAKPRETQDGKPLTTTVVGSEVTSFPGEVGDRAGARVPEWVSLGQEVVDLAGLDGARGGFDCRPVQAWLNAGHDAEVIRAAVRRVAGRPGYEPGRVFSLKFFDRAVAQEAAMAPAAPLRLSAEERRAEAERFEAIERRIAATLAGQSVAAA